MMPVKLLKIFVMLMATSATAASTLTNILALNQSMEMNIGSLSQDIGSLLGQTINLKVDKEELDENNTKYQASSEQSMTFTEVTGIKLPYPMDGRSLTTKFMFTVQETKKLIGSSFKGKISMESPWIPVDLVSIPFSGELNQNAFLIGVDYKGFKVKLNFSYNSTLEQFQVVIHKVGMEEDVIKLGSITLDKDRMVKSTFSAKEYPQLSEHIDKIFLSLGKFWFDEFDEKCTLERAKMVAMVMFEWSSALTPRESLHVKGLASVPSLYPKEYDWSWFQFKLPAFLFRSWA